MRLSGPEISRCVLKQVRLLFSWSLPMSLSLDYFSSLFYAICLGLFSGPLFRASFLGLFSGCILRTLAACCLGLFSSSFFWDPFLRLFSRSVHISAHVSVIVSFIVSFSCLFLWSLVLLSSSFVGVSFLGLYSGSLV